MANVIIRPEHQAAPKVEELRTAQVMRSVRSSKHSDQWFKDYDEEMTPVYDEAMKREMEQLRYTTESSEEAVEMMLQRFEENYCSEATRKQRWDGQLRWMGKEAEEMRRGRVMHAYTFMEILRRSGVDARIDTPTQLKWVEGEGGVLKHFVTPTISSARLWLNHGSNRGLVGVNAWVKDEATGMMIEKTVTSLQYPYGQEWSVMRFDQYNIPKKEKYRGWRTTLLVLIIAGVLTEKEAHKAFGEGRGAASEFYQMQLQIQRNLSMGVKQ
jgi:hypothetical protein